MLKKSSNASRLVDIFCCVIKLNEKVSNLDVLQEERTYLDVLQQCLSLRLLLVLRLLLLLCQLLLTRARVQVVEQALDPIEEEYHLVHLQPQRERNISGSFRYSDAGTVMQCKD